MQTEDIFKHAKTFDSTPAYCNINRRAGEEAFDDLLDPEDPDQDTQATGLALRKANQVRTNVGPFAVSDSTTHYILSIQNAFQRAVYYPTRFSDGSYPVWYGCMDQLTTIYETANHMIREEIDLRGHPKAIHRQRLVYKVACTAILIDLGSASRKFPQLIDSSSYSFTQQIGKRVRTEMHPGLLAPSARHQGGVNLVIFTPRVLSSPELVGNLSYQLDPSSMRLTVSDDKNQHTEICIDERKWI
ncbi:MAG: RES family NAD+ phosphorylase [Deltaproteobacteria bacterium]|nr:RES family NAD+ phosphorylase [Deltaproteobacteria bacterium]